MLTESPTLFSMTPIPDDCGLCRRIGLRIAPTGPIETCPAITLNQPHADLSPPGRRIVRAVTVLRRRGLEPDVIHFDVARTLAGFTTEKPCTTAILIERHFSYVKGDENQRRAVTLAVRFLRDIWFLPVGSRKSKPSGYWVITDEQDFREWVELKSREPIAFLSTIRRVARANWPEFAEQIEIDFWKDMVDPPDEVDRLAA